MENFADLADLANQKHIDQVLHSEGKKDKLTEIYKEIEKAVKKSDHLTMGPHLQHIFKHFNRALEDLEDYIEDMDKHGR